MDMEILIMNLIVDAGSARSASMQSIAMAKEGRFDEAKKMLEEANESLLKVHHLQTGLIQKEAGGERTELSLLMVHAQDHLMTAMLARDLASEFVALYESIKSE